MPPLKTPIKQPYIFLLLPLLIYLLTSAPAHTGYTDSDFLTAMGYLAGVGHPPGYTLLTSLTHLFTYIPIPTNIYQRTSILSAILQTLNLMLLYYISLHLLTQIKPKFPNIKQIALTATLITAFSSQVWLQATLFEKYTLASLLTLLTLYSYFKKYPIYIQGFLLGPSIAYHELGYTLLPTLWMLHNFPKPKLTKPHLQYISTTILGYLSNALLLYLINLHTTTYSWNFPQTLDGLKQHLLRTNYQDFHTHLFTFDNAPQGLYHFLLELGQNYIWLPIIIAIIGAITIYKKLPRSYSALTLQFLLTGPLIASGVGWPDIKPETLLIYLHQFTMMERTHLYANLILTPFIGIGLMYLINKYKLTQKPNLLISTLIILPLTLLILNYSSNNLSQFNQVRTFSQQTLDLLPPNTLFIVYEDYPSFALLYEHIINGYRPDITIIPLNRFMRHRFEQTLDLQTFNLSKNPERITDIIGTKLNTRPIFLLGLPQDYAKILGLDQHIIEYIPHQLPQITDLHSPCKGALYNHCNLITTYSQKRSLIELRPNPRPNLELQQTLLRNAAIAQSKTDLLQARYFLLQAWLIQPDQALIDQINLLTAEIDNQQPPI